MKTEGKTFTKYMYRSLSQGQRERILNSASYLMKQMKISHVLPRLAEDNLFEYVYFYNEGYEDRLNNICLGLANKKAN